MKSNIRKIATRATAVFGMVFLMGLSLFGGAQSVKVTAQENIPAKVDTYNPIGTVINLFDYWVDSADANDNNDVADHINKGINKDHILTFMKSGDVLNGDRERNIDANKYTGANGGPRYNIVENWLGDDGYPVLRQGSNGISRAESLDYLFDATNFEGKKAYINAKDLLKVDGDGYYTYNSKENFAAFDEDTNSFSIYEKAAVKNGNDIFPVGGNVGQFFPFNSAQEVFDGDVTSTDERLNHYFGVTVTSRFSQPTKGYVNGEAMTYEFAGDDDVWIFIDDVLIADLGGIHSAVSTKIDFSTGNVYISNTESVADNASATTTLYKQYRDAYFEKYDQTEANARLDKMFVQNGRNYVYSDDSVHTIKFFYLERGNGASNMNLKFNLKSVPENSIVKVDEMGNAISGVRFRLYQADENYNFNEDRDLISFGTSDDAGNITLVDIDDPNSIIDFNELHDRGIDHYVLREISDTNNQDYRISPDIELRYTTYGDGDLGHVMVNNVFETGAYSLPRQLIFMDAKLPVKRNPNATEKEIDLSKGGTAFAVIMYRDKNEDCANDAGCWYPLSGDALSGYKKASESALNPDKGVKEEIITVGKENNYIANVSSNGAYEILVDEMPGNIDQYYFVNGQNLANTSFNVALFYTEGNLSEATPKNTYFINTIQDSEHINRTFSSSVHVPNVVNRLIVQKLDSQNNTIGDPDDPDSALNATFALYREDAVVDGKLVEGALPHDTVRVNQKTYGSNYINVEDATINAAIFPSAKGKLQNGTYYLKEITAPEGYAINDELVKVIVNDDGVFADAGSQNDGVFVRSGVGHVLKTMAQFTAADDIDNTLTNIVTTLETSSDLKNWTSQDGSTIHLKHKNTLNNGNLYIEYGKEVENPDDPYITAGSDEGYTRLKIEQCKEHKTEPRQELNEGTDIARLFTGTTIVQISDDPLIGGSKTVSGKDNWGEDFKIKLELISKDGAAVTDTSLNQEITLSGANAKENVPVSYELDKIKFSSAGTYIFKISEEKGLDPNYAYDDTAYYLKAEVVIDDVGQKGVLHTNYEIVDESGNKIEGAKLDELNFHNVYMELSALSIQKIVNAPDLTPDGDTSFNVEVSFTLPDGFDKDTYALLDGEEASDGDINFKDHIDDTNISFTIKANEVKKIINIPKGVTYTISEVNIPQGFSLNDAKSTSLSGELSNDDINASLYNDYNVAPIQDTITIIKNFEGREWRDTDSFSFIIEGTGLNGQKSVTIDNNSQDHSEDFALTFDKPGEYTYRIEEASPQSSIPGVSYSSEVYNVKFNVIDNGDGTLSVDEKTITKDDQAVQSVTFTNTYNAGNPIAIDMIGRKHYTDNTNAMPLEKDMFTFIVEAEDGAPLPSIANGNREWKVTNDKEGNINFGNLEINKDYFTSKPQSLAYTYTIKEDTANPIEGVTYDDTVYTVNMTISIDEDENISRIVKFFKDGTEFTPAQGEIAVSFKNSYTAKSAEAVLGFSKELNTPKGFDFDKAPDTNFTFTLEANDDKTKDAITKGDVVMPANSEVNIPLKDLKDGEVSSSFEAISFNKVGQYTFKISESKGDTKGFSYDQTPIIATVDVKLNKDTSSLEYAITYQKGDTNSSDLLTFTNQYTLGSSDPVSLTGQKIMQGWKLENSAFKFLVTDPNGESTTVSNNYPTDEHTAVINLINGVTFDEVGTYTYTVTEIRSNGLGLSNDVIKYDESEYEITYEVTIDYGNAKLIATPTILKDGQEVQKVTFENVYDPGTIEVDGQLSKVLEGRDLNDGEFKFEMNLHIDDGFNTTGATILNPLLENDADGNIKWHSKFPQG